MGEIPRPFSCCDGAENESENGKPQIGGLECDSSPWVGRLFAGCYRWGMTFQDLSGVGNEPVLGIPVEDTTWNLRSFPGSVLRTSKPQPPIGERSFFLGNQCKAHFAVPPYPPAPMCDCYSPSQTKTWQFIRHPPGTLPESWPKLQRRSLGLSTP